MIEVKNLRKEFFVAETLPGPLGAIRSLFMRKGHTVVAVDDISFDIQPGEFVGYIGPNGAGKSTTIKMLTGILHPTSGTVSVLGMSPQSERRKVVRHIGVVFGQRSQLWWDLPLYDSFELLAAMYGVPKARMLQLLDKYDSILGIGEFWRTPVRKLSLGQRMRGEICAALLHEPQILFLDEPTIGLDVVAKEAIRSFLQQINQQGVTIILTTHDLGDIEKLCQRVMVINRGTILFDGSLQQLHCELGELSRMAVDYEEPVDIAELVGCTQLAMNQVKPNRIEVAFDRSRVSANEILQILGQLGAIKDIHITEPDIETAITKLF